MTTNKNSLKMQILINIRDILLAILKKQPLDFTAEDSVIVENLYNILEKHAPMDFLLW